MSENQFSDQDKAALEDAKKNRTMPISLGDIADPDKAAIEEAKKNRTMPISLGDIAEAASKPAAFASDSDEGAANRTMRIDIADMEPEPQSVKTDRMRVQPPAARPPVTRQIPLTVPGIPIGSIKPGQQSPAQRPPMAPGLTQHKKETSRVVPPSKGTDRIIMDEPVAGKDAKRSTTPINTAPQPSAPKTIRLKRPATTIVAVQPGAAPRSSAPETIVKTVKLSRETSKISAVTELAKKETTRVLMEIDGAASSSTDKRSTKAIDMSDADANIPKTILLKKPANAATVLHPGGADKKSTDAIKKSTDAILSSSRKGQTTRIEIMGQDNSSAEGAGGQQAPSTQIKTVKLRRSTQPPSVDPAALGAEGKDEGIFDSLKMPSTRRGQDDIEDEEQMNIAFPILAVVALLVVVVLTYILSSQAFGPTLSVPMPFS